MAAKTFAALVGLSLTACVEMSFAQKQSPPLPERADPPAPIRIYVVIHGELSGLRPWTVAREFEVALEQAGFDAIVVDERSEVPPGAPFTEQFSHSSGAGYPDDPNYRHYEWWPTVWTFGLFPTFRDLQYGWSFKLYRQRGAPVERVRARWTAPVTAGWLAIPLHLIRGDELAWSHIPDEAERAREVAVLRVALLDALAQP